MVEVPPSSRAVVVPIVLVVVGKSVVGAAEANSKAVVVEPETPPPNSKAVVVPIVVGVVGKSVLVVVVVGKSPRRARVVVKAAAVLVVAGGTYDG